MLSKREIIELLSLRGAEQKELFRLAAAHRDREFGGMATVRGVIEITNLCRVNCHYCPMRLDNTKSNDTYLMSPGDILQIATQIRDCGIRIVFLQGGEIPQTTKLVAAVLPEIRELFAGDVELLLCLGNKTTKEFALLRQLGADSYILKHETTDAELHKRLRESSWPARKRCLADLLRLGYRVGTGVIVGLPNQRLETLADDLLFAKELGAHMMSASPFVPAPNTPISNAEPGDIDITLNLMAATRLIEPRWLIPSVSAMERTRVGGHLEGLRAGANVLTANFTPTKRRNNYLIYGRQRFVSELQHVQELLQLSDLRSPLAANHSLSG